MNKLSLALALATTANAVWIPIGHGASSEDNNVPTGTVEIAIPTIADPDATLPTGTVPIAIPTFIVSEEVTKTYEKPVPPIYTLSTKTYEKPVPPIYTLSTKTYEKPVPPIYTLSTKTYEKPVPPIYTLSTKTYEKPAPPIYTISTKTDEAPVETVTSVVFVPGPCNTGTCHPHYTTKTIVAPVPTSSCGCSPARPSLCPPALLPHPNPSNVHRPPVPVPTGHDKPMYPNTTYPDPRPIDGRFWTIKNMTRYCGADGKACDYNFAIEADGKTENCTIVRHPGSDAAIESWNNVPCNDKSEFTVSWGYVTEPAPAFSVVTVVKGKILAWFGVADINGQKVTASNPFGSGHYGNLGPDQVYTY